MTPCPSFCKLVQLYMPNQYCEVLMVVKVGDLLTTLAYTQSNLYVYVLSKFSLNCDTS